MDFEEITRACQLAMNNGYPGSPHRFAHAEMLTILQRPNISPAQADELLLGQRAKYLALSRAEEIPVDDQIYWGEVHSHMSLVGSWVRRIVEEQERFYGSI